MAKIQETLGLYLTLIAALAAICALIFMIVDFGFMTTNDDISGEAFTMARTLEARQADFCPQGYTYACSCVIEQPTAENPRTSSSTADNDDDEDEHWGSS